MINNEWTTELQQIFGSKRVRLPGFDAIAICGDKAEVVIRMSVRGLLANMTTDAAAFEGWALVLRTWCDVEKVTLTWAIPRDGASSESELSALPLPSLPVS
jgi:hypothetical protein